MDFAEAVDRRVFVSIGPSGGSPTLMMVGLARFDAIAVAEFNLINILGRFFVNKVIFRGGWTVRIDAPDCDPTKIRCRSRADAEQVGRRVLAAAGVEAASDVPVIEVEKFTTW